jgi:hypothetical protein
MYLFLYNNDQVQSIKKRKLFAMLKEKSELNYDVEFILALENLKNLLIHYIILK